MNTRIMGYNGRREPIDSGTTARTNNLPNRPQCITNPSHAELEIVVDDVMKAFDNAMFKVAVATNWIDTRSAAGRILGDRSFTAGVLFGMGENIIKSVFDLAEMAQMFVLAEVYSVRHAKGFWETLARSTSLILAPGGAQMLIQASFSPTFEIKTREAHETRAALFAAVAYAVEHPTEAFKSITDEYVKKYQEYKTHMAKHSLAGSFQAGQIFGELLIELLLTVDGVTTIAKIASKVPGLARAITRLEKVVPMAKGSGQSAEAAKAAKAAEKSAAEAAAANKAKARAKAEADADPARQGNAKKDGSPCPYVAKPVDAINGCKVLFEASDLDFDLPAILPMPWQRSYSSDNPRTGWLGQGWHLPIALALEFAPEQITLLDGLNRGIAFHHLSVGESFYSRHEQITLLRLDLFTFELTDQNDVRNRFVLPNHAARIAHLVSQTDYNGNGISIEYDARQQPIKIIDSAGRVLVLAFNEQARLINVAEMPQTGQTTQAAQAAQAPTTLVSYEYDTNGDLVRVRNRAGEVTREFAYANHIMIKHAQPGGLVSEYDYTEHTPKGKVLRNHTNIGLSWQFVYAKSQTLVTDNLGRKAYYGFNENKRYTGGTDAMGGKQVRELDAYGNLLSLTDAAGNTTRYQYDTRSRLTRIQDADGAVTEISYDMRFDKPVMITNAAGGITRLRYDGYTNLTSIVDPLGQTTQYRPDKRGLVTEIIDARGGSKKLEYNAAGQVTRYTDCSDQTTSFEYDRFGNLIQTEDALGHTTSYQYDDAGRLTTASYPDGSSEQYEYDQLGRLVGHTDGAGQKTTYQLDPEGRLLKRTNALGGTLAYHYDAGKRLAQLVNENGAVYAFEYDALDRLRQETGFDARTTRYDYDLASRPKSKTELGQISVAANGADHTIQTVYQRDAMGRLVEKTVTGSAPEHSTPLVTSYQYDILGRLRHAANASALVDLEYDAIGQLLAEKTRMPSGNGILHSVLRHSYDELGNRTQTVLPDGRTLNNLYYGSGHLHQINIDGEVISDIERDARHREISRTQGALTSQFQYDPVGRLTAQIAKLDPSRTHASLAQQREVWAGGGDGALRGAGTGTGAGGATIARQYQYDLAGNLIGQDDQRFGKTVYQYDAIGRILSANQPNLAETFAFDPAHNLLDPASTGSGSGGRVENNQVTVFEDKRYGYDSHGNLIDKKIARHTHITLAWNAEHQLIKAQTTRNAQADAPPVQQTEYGYDPFGRRVFKRDAFGETRFVWDGNRLLAEARGSHTRTWVYEVASFVPLAQLDSKLQPDTAKPKADVLYFHTDHLGTPRELTDSGGNLQWAATYKAWGNVLRVEMEQCEVASEPNALEQMQALRFQGQYFDGETGLHYNRFRYYDPDIGRFISQDPIGLKGGDNLYRYAPNPTGWIDPYGLSGKPCGDGPNKKTTYEGTSRRDALRQAKRDAGVPNSQQPTMSRDYLLDGDGNKILKPDGTPVEVRQYHYTTTDGNKVVIQEHSLGHEKATPLHGAEPHFNVRPVTNLGTGSVPGTHGHYNF